MRAWLYMVGGIAAVAPATAVASPRAADASAAPSSDTRHAPTGTHAERRVVAPADISGSYFMGAFNGGIERDAG